MESFGKRHPALTILAIALVLWIALNWWRKKHPEIPGASAGAGSTNVPQTAAQKIAAKLDTAQNWLAKAAIVVPPLALLTPGTATRVYNNIASFIDSGGPSIDQTIKFASGSGTLPLSAFKGSLDLPGIPSNAQINHNGEITFDGTAAGNYVAAWRQAGFQVYVSGNAITLKPDPTAAQNPGAPPIAPPPAGA